jgi:hypothetical protein
VRTAQEIRDAVLADIAAGLAKLDDSRTINGPHHKTALWRVEVALFDEAGNVLAVGPITHALRWVVENVHQIEDTTDISNAVSAHVQIREGKCFGPLCGHAHNEPAPE